MKHSDWDKWQKQFIELAIIDHYEVDLVYSKSVQDILLGFTLKKKARLVEALKNLKGFTGDIDKRTLISDICELIYSGIKNYPH
jgi:hypothetical protein